MSYIGKREGVTIVLKYNVMNSYQMNNTVAETLIRCLI